MNLLKIKWLPVYMLTAISIAQSGTKTNFGSDWEFRRDEKSPWEKVTIPHTARVEPLIVNDQYQGTCQYRKNFVIDARDKKVLIYFEGVMQDADVSDNGHQIIDHKGGYLPFTADVSEWVKTGSNLIEVDVTNTDNPEIPPGKPLRELDFNYYGGIYRNVYLITSDKLYLTNAVAENKVAGGGLLIHFDKIDRNLASGTINAHQLYPIGCFRKENDLPDARI